MEGSLYGICLLRNFGTLSDFISFVYGGGRESFSENGGENLPQTAGRDGKKQK